MVSMMLRQTLIGGVSLIAAGCSSLESYQERSIDTITAKNDLVLDTSIESLRAVSNGAMQRHFSGHPERLRAFLELSGWGSAEIRVFEQAVGGSRE